MNVVKRLLVRFIAGRWLRWVIELKGGTYLANFAILERTAGDGKATGGGHE